MTGTRILKLLKQDSVVADDMRKWLERILTHDEDNHDETDVETVEADTDGTDEDYHVDTTTAASVSVPHQMTSISKDRTSMREDTKLARYGDTWKFG